MYNRYRHDLKLGHVKCFEVYNLLLKHSRTTVPGNSTSSLIIAKRYA